MGGNIFRKSMFGKIVVYSGTRMNPTQIEMENGS